MIKPLFTAGCVSFECGCATCSIPWLDGDWSSRIMSVRLVRAGGRNSRNFPEFGLRVPGRVTAAGVNFQPASVISFICFGNGNGTRSSSAAGPGCHVLE